MSTTATETKAAPAEFTIIARVGSIPLVACSLQSIDSALSKSNYTRFSYSTAKEFSSSAIKYVEPIQARLSPLVARADGLANKAVDIVESRYPYPFKARPEEVSSLIQEKKQSATDFVTVYYNETGKKIDENIKTPAINAATEIDKRFCPLVDYYEVAVKRTSNSEAGPSTPPDAQYQYQRALALSSTLKDNIYDYSSEQFKLLQNQNAIVQRATATAQSINEIATSSVTTTKAQIHQMSDTMIVELQNLQCSTLKFSASIRSTVHDSAAQIQNQIPPQIKNTFTEASNNLSAAVTEFKNILATGNITLQEKIIRLEKEVQSRITPLLEAAKQTVSDMLARAKDGASHAAPPRADGANDS
ncbi:hypothetical protein DXG01_017215 [Tephrocybe rancida]|nr:hypothetical protein DXG01_017215 [Tephrocybe rancida]